jgi:hypothetical protein
LAGRREFLGRAADFLGGRPIFGWKRRNFGRTGGIFCAARPIFWEAGRFLAGTGVFLAGRREFLGRAADFLGGRPIFGWKRRNFGRTGGIFCAARPISCEASECLAKHGGNMSDERENWARALARAASARRCEICGARAPADGRWRLQAHHLDHTRQTAARDLVVLVCPKCHTRAHQWMATDWRWLFNPPEAIRARVLAWWAARCGLTLTPGECEERAAELLAIMRERLAAVFAPIDPNERPRE